ncbi:MAG: ROK family protein, partial [Patescibacteria group bacterium]
EALANRGDRRARQVLDTMANWLAVGLANAIYSYSPNIVVLGGGLSSVTRIVNPAVRRCRRLVRIPELARTKVAVSPHRYESSIIGAALLTNARHHL